jgi:hypothetical protein
MLILQFKTIILISAIDVADEYVMAVGARTPTTEVPSRLPRLSRLCRQGEQRRNACGRLAKRCLCPSPVEFPATIAVVY